MHAVTESVATSIRALRLNQNVQRNDDGGSSSGTSVGVTVRPVSNVTLRFNPSFRAATAARA